MSTPVRQIVVISRMTYGDFVLVLPFLAELRRRYPGAKITMLCGHRGADLTRLYPSVDEVVDLQNLRSGRSFFRTLTQLLALLRSDLIFAIYPFFFAAVTAFLLAGRRRIGFCQAFPRLYIGSHRFEEIPSVTPFQEWVMRRVLLHRPVTMQTREGHATMRLFQLLEPGADAWPPLCGALSAVYPRTFPARPRIILAPFSGWLPRNWPLPRWRQLAESLLNSRRDAEILINTDPGSANTAREAFSGLAGVEIFEPGNDFDRLFRTFAGASLVVSNDSFPLHAATVLNVPSVGLFGPNLPQWFGSLAHRHHNLFESIECNPCRQGRANERCLQGLLTCAVLERFSVEAVAAHCLAVLSP